MAELSGPVAPPVARVEVVREQCFGVSLADPYRWMEAEDAELADWLTGQARHTASMLAGLPGRAELGSRVRELAAGGPADSLFRLAGERVFFLREQAGAAVPVLMVADGPTARVLLDPAGQPGAGQPGAGQPGAAAQAHSSVDWFVPSPDGRYVACGISQGGSESSTLHVVDADDGELLENAIPGTSLGAISWLPGSAALLYHRYVDPPAGTPPHQRRHDSRACLHRLGTAVADDVVVLARGLSPLVPMSPVDRPLVFTAAGSNWLVAVISHSSLSLPAGEELSDCSLYVAPRSGLADPATCPWRRVAGPADGVTAYAVHGDDLYLVTHRGAPRSQVVSVRMDGPGSAAEVVPGGERVVVGLRVIGDSLLVHERADGLSRLRQVPLTGGQPREVPLPVDGFVEEWTAHPCRADALITLSSWTRSPRIYRYDGAVLAQTRLLPPSAADFSDVVVSDLRVPARDGTAVPVRVVHRAGLVLDGTNPAILSGYGSYGIVPYWGFEPEMLAWYERGGIYAEAGLRGGGEYGREWHEAGRGQRKVNTITDFIDCAEYLIAQGYTSPERLAGRGASAGAIPVSGALVRRPDLFGAIVLKVPATNQTRAEFSENGPVNVPEFGSAATEAGLRDLLTIDSYLQVEDGTPYPAVLLTTGLNDSRVAVWQPAKMAARLQAATTSGRPVLLRVDTDAGHGYGSTRTQRNELTADILAFLMHELKAPARTTAHPRDAEPVRTQP